MSENKLRLRIVAADFNKEIVDTMIEGALAEANNHGITLVDITRVPGAYELPFAANYVISRSDCDLVVVLGYIERGETLHGEVMGHVVSRMLLELSLKHNIPVGLGIIGPGATLAQAVARAEPSARAAVRAAASCARLG